MTEFERWADEHGYSLEPAVRRRTVPASLIDADSSYTEICVPIMMLALERADAGSLCGVVSYTIVDGTDESTTYTVYDWLTAAEEATAAADARGSRLPDGRSTIARLD